MAEEIDVEKCDFRNFTSSMSLTLTMYRVEVILVHICGPGLPTYQIRSKLDVWMDGRTRLPIVDLLGHRLGNDLKIGQKL